MRALSDLASDTANHPNIILAGALPLLITLLGSSSAGVQEEAARAVVNLSKNNDDYAIANAGAIPPLVALLGSRSFGVQQQAAAALANLANNEVGCARVAAAGAISPLVALLDSSSKGVQTEAAEPG